MRYDDLPQSDNIEDRRGDGGGGGGGGFPMAAEAGSASAPSWCSASSATRSGSIRAC